MIDVRFQPMQKRPRWDAEKFGKYLAKSPFKARGGMDDLERELKFLGATDVVIESGHSRDQIRNDGWPRGGSAPAHPDIRLYFKCKHGTLRYECIRFDSWEANLRAIGLWMQRQRLAIEEWGIGAGGEAYRGFAALPAGIQAVEWVSADSALRWLQEFSGGDSATEYSKARRDAARKAHPDTGGSTELMSKVNRACELIEKSREAVRA